jgi:membrane-associated phospholipid phosphatase
MSTRFNRFIKYVERNVTYIVSMSFATFSLSLFFLILGRIDPHEVFGGLDQKTYTAVLARRRKYLSKIMLLITRLGDIDTVTVMMIMLSSYLYKTRHWNSLISLAVAVGGGQTFVAIVKNLIKRERPDFVNALRREKYFSFPSGHSFVAVCLYGFVTYLGLQLVTGWKKLFVVFSGLAVILGIGFSRIYLGAHWLSDVLASFAAGTAWLTMSLTFLEAKRARDIKKKDTLSKVDWEPVV